MLPVYTVMEISKVPTKFDLVSYSLIRFWFQKYGLWVILEGIILKKNFWKIHTGKLFTSNFL
jgi:hypothetical protein